MKRLLSYRKQWHLSAVLLTLLCATSASANPFPRVSVMDMLRIAEGPTFPPEWAGIWVMEDSTFTCQGAFEGFSVENDTLCTGAPISEPGESPLGILDCTGTADATSITSTCTGSFVIFPDCVATFTTTLSATRTGDSITATSEFSITYEGGGLGCSSFPAECEESRTTGMRIAGEPESCSTAVEATDWGLVKQLFK